MKYREDSFYIQKVLRGNVASYAILVEKYKDFVFTLSVRIARNHEDAEEIAQDAFLKAFNALSTFKDESKFSTWLYKIVFNTAISKMRKKELDKVSLSDVTLPDAVQEEELTGLDKIHNKERKRIIAAAIAGLKENEAVVLTLFYLNEYNIGEIEEITGFTNSNIKILLHRGRKKLLFELRKILKEEIVDIL